MSVERFQNLIGSARYKTALNQDTNIGLELEQKTKPLIEYNLIDIVNLQEIYAEEREKSNKYRFSGKINIYTTNSLSSGSTFYVQGTGFNDYAWNPLFQGEAPNNWVMQILYPSESLPNFQIKYYTAATATFVQSSKAFRGPQYKNFEATVINNSRYLAVACVQKHNLKPDDYVYLYSNTNDTYRGIFKVLTLGINGENFDKNFVLDLTLDTVPTVQGAPPNVYYTPIPNVRGNFIKINNPSFDDINFSNSSVFFDVTTSDLSGNTTLIPYNNDEERYLTVRTNEPHNLNVNNYVDIRVNAGSDLNGVWRVYNILGGSGSTKFIIKADIGITNKGVTIQPAPMRDYRILDGIPSEYYVRNFEVLTTNDYEVYNCAFSTNTYPNNIDPKIGLANKTWLFHFNEDIDLNRIRDNRKGPITELYYSIIKRSGIKPFDWGNVISNWDFNIKKTVVLNGIETISVSNPNNVGSIEKHRARKEFLDTNGEIQYIPGDKYIVDFVEFNPIELSETTLSIVNHTFRPPSTGTQGGGYYYSPYKKLKLREYSSIVNVVSSNENYDEIPDNYFVYPDSSKAWKDLLPIGYSEKGNTSIDYPFLNNANYYYFDFNLYLRRQVVPINNIINNNRLRYVKETEVNSKC